MSTVSPRKSREVAEQVRSVGAEMLDAQVSGSIPQAESGTLAIMVGGGEQAFENVEPLLRVLGQTVTHIGDHGQGLVLKLAINISFAVQVLSFSEGLLLAERDGVAYVPRVLRSVRADWGAARRHDVPGTGTRAMLVAAAVGGGAALALALLPTPRLRPPLAQKTSD